LVAELLPVPLDQVLEGPCRHEGKCLVVWCMFDEVQDDWPRDIRLGWLVQQQRYQRVQRTIGGMLQSEPLSP
jgi:hypothetical protein